MLYKSVTSFLKSLSAVLLSAVIAGSEERDQRDARGQRLRDRLLQHRDGGEAVVRFLWKTEFLLEEKSTLAKGRQAATVSNVATACLAV